MNKYPVGTSIFFKFPAGSNLNDIFLKEKSKYYNFYKKGKCPSYMIEEALENLLDNYLNTYTPEYNQEPKVEEQERYFSFKRLQFSQSVQAYYQPILSGSRLFCTRTM